MIRALVIDCEDLQKALYRKKRLSPEKRKLIEDTISESQKLITAYKQQLAPYMEKIDDPSMVTYIRKYFFEAKTIQGAEGCGYGATGSLHRRVENNCRAFWQL